MSYWKIAAYAVASAVAGGALGAATRYRTTKNRSGIGGGVVSDRSSAAAGSLVGQSAASTRNMASQSTAVDPECLEKSDTIDVSSMLNTEATRVNGLESASAATAAAALPYTATTGASPESRGDASRKKEGHGSTAVASATAAAVVTAIAATTAPVRSAAMFDVADPQQPPNPSAAPPAMASTAAIASAGADKPSAADGDPRACHSAAAAQSATVARPCGFGKPAFTQADEPVEGSSESSAERDCESLERLRALTARLWSAPAPAAAAGDGGEAAGCGAPAAQSAPEQSEACPTAATDSGLQRARLRYSRVRLAEIIGLCLSSEREKLSLGEALWEHIRECGIDRSNEDLPTWSRYRVDPPANAGRVDGDRRRPETSGGEWQSERSAYSAAQYSSSDDGADARCKTAPARSAAPSSYVVNQTRRPGERRYCDDDDYDWVVGDERSVDGDSAAAYAEAQSRASTDYRAYGDDDSDPSRFVAVEGSTNSYKIELADYCAEEMSSDADSALRSGRYWQQAASRGGSDYMYSGEPASLALASAGCGTGAADDDDSPDAAYFHQRERRGGRSYRNEQPEPRRWSRQGGNLGGSGGGYRSRRLRRAQGEGLPGRHEIDPTSGSYREAQAAVVAAVARHVAWDPSLRDASGGGNGGGGTAARQYAYRY